MDKENEDRRSERRIERLSPTGCVFSSRKWVPGEVLTFGPFGLNLLLRTIGSLSFLTMVQERILNPKRVADQRLRDPHRRTLQVYDKKRP